MNPGARVTTLTPAGASSTRRLSQYVFPAAFDALYAPAPGRPPTAATLAIPTRRPRPRCFIDAMNGSQVDTVVLRLTAMIASNTNSEKRRVGKECISQ